MESSKDLLRLLVRFSNSIWILKYFGNFEEWEKVMKQLCTQTLESWNENKEMYLSIQPLERKWLEIGKNFDKESSEFLLKDELYLKYRLCLDIYDYSDKAGEFLKFLETIQNPKQLIFKSINIDYALKVDYLKFYKFIMDNWIQDPRSVFKSVRKWYSDNYASKDEKLPYKPVYNK